MELNWTEKLTDFQKEKAEIVAEMSNPDILKNQKQYEELVRRMKEIDKWLFYLEELNRVEKHIFDDKEIISNEIEIEIIEEAKKDLEKNQIKKEKIEKEIKILIDKESESEDDKINNIILEIRAGTGGDEAAIFAFDLYRMYVRYCEKQKWSVAIWDENMNDAGGYKEVVAEIKGNGCFKDLKYEAGVHRVQRVPTTEKQGRIHTSTATVAILPKVTEKEIELKDGDLEFDFFKSSGKGGQNVQKVETAVRIKHKPTGIVVTCQVERSQLKNRERAMSVLRSKLWEAEKEKQFGNIDDARRSQVGTAKRCEKIRTYNFPQDRITDHRLGESFHGIESVMEGNIENIIEATKKLNDSNFVLNDLDNE